MKYLRWVGVALSVVGVGFVISLLSDYAGELGGFRPDITQLSLLVVLACAYGASNFALAYAWRDLLEHCGSPSAARWAVPVYGVTQLAKYIPGNVFHLAGRVTMGISAGHSAGALLKSVVWEIAAIVAAAVVFAVWIAPLLLDGVTYVTATILFAVALLTIGLIAQRFFSILVRNAILWYVGFLFTSGVLFFATIQLLLPNEDLLTAFPVICSAYIIAWLAGLITPGAPAGIGIREVVIFALLKSLVGHSDLLVAIVLSRAITAGGDALFYVFALTATKEE